jgi:hypothetical protein
MQVFLYIAALPLFILGVYILYRLFIWISMLAGLSLIYAILTPFRAGSELYKWWKGANSWYLAFIVFLIFLIVLVIFISQVPQ